MSSTAPRAFVSYSWTTEEHRGWVRQLAEKLRGDGVEVILDQWHLDPGQDMFQFMEQMVADPAVTKVLIICDQTYAQKADNREGGVGTEAQIITPAIYKRTDQTKFVGVIREKDGSGEPYLPAYLRGRMCIDMSEDDMFHDAYRDLLLWALGIKKHVPPAVGSPPPWIAAAATDATTVIRSRGAREALRRGDKHAGHEVADYFSSVIDVVKKAKFDDHMAVSDEDIFEAINSLAPVTGDCLSVYNAIARYMPSHEMTGAVHRFLECLLPLIEIPSSRSSFYGWESDHISFLVHETFLHWLGTLLQFEQYSSFSATIAKPFYAPHLQARFNRVIAGYPDFRRGLPSFGQRNSRLRLNRMDLRADLLKSRAEAAGISFDWVMQADLVLFIRSQLERQDWWPHTLLYSTHRFAPFEAFARAQSRQHWEKLKAALGVEAVVALKDIITNEGSLARSSAWWPKWGHYTLSVSELTGYPDIGKLP